MGIAGEWWKADTEAVINQAMQTGGAPNISDAFTFNGLPGPSYNCSAQGTLNSCLKQCPSIHLYLSEGVDQCRYLQAQGKARQILFTPIDQCSTQRRALLQHRRPHTHRRRSRCRLRQALQNQCRSHHSRTDHERPSPHQIQRSQCHIPHRRPAIRHRTGRL